MNFRLSLAFLILLPILASAATTNVTVGQGGTNFNPSAVTIRVGDIVNWNWAANNHSATSGTPNNPNGIFDSGIRNNGSTFPVTFGVAGTYPYYCRVHGAMMTGTVTVVVATPTPTPTPAGTPTPTATAATTSTPISTPTPSAAPTLTPTPTATATPIPTATPTPVPTTTPTPTPTPFSSHSLLFPPTSTAAEVPISIAEACVSILDGPCTYMWTYGGTYPGLTMRRPTGQTTRVTFFNNLPTLAGGKTVHHHGSHSASADDGQVTGANFLFEPGQARTYTYEGIENGENERGAMQWYHDHRMGETGMSVWMGLTGLFIIDDPADPATLPSGPYDLPLVIADRQFDGSNQLQYFYDPAGVVGDTVLVNGVYQPYLDVADCKYRLRILNGANARTYIFTLSSGDAFTQIGTESGLLPAPVTRTAMNVGPAERVDVVVDFAGKLGQELYLMDAYQVVPLLKFRVNHGVIDTSTIPSILRPPPDIGQPTVTRNFSFDFTSNHWTINGLVFDPNRIDARPVLGTTEKWVFTNPTGTTHMVHIHDVDQQCLSRDGGPCYPYETMKETWAVGPGETLQLKMKFTDHVGIYMLHCHILEHEDDGMMTQFEVIAPTPTPTPPPGTTPTPTPAPTTTPGATTTPTVAPSATPGATATATASPTPQATATVAPTVTPGATATPSATPGSAPAQPLNISTRARVQGGDSVLIGGFILTGSDSKQVIIRALGPSLGANGMPGALSDTTLDLYDANAQLLASNDNWKDSQQTQIQATGIAPSDPLESAILTPLNGNSSYTAVVRGKNGATGIGLVEIYDLGLGANSKLANISTRGFVDTGDNVMIGGFIVGGSAANHTRVVVRAIGPSLSRFGLTNALQDPTLSFYDSNGSLWGANDNWQDGHQPEVVAAGLAPTDDRESALFQSLPPGAYTAIVSGKDGATGVGLVEAYNIP